MTPIKTVPLLDVEKAWILRLHLAGMTGPQVAKTVGRFENAVFKFIKSQGYVFGETRELSPDARDLAQQAREECGAARAEWLKINRPPPVPEAPRSDRAIWRYSTGGANGKPIPITLPRIRGLQTPVEQGRAFLWSMGGRGRQMEPR